MALNFYELAKSRPIEQSVDSKSVTLKYIGMYSTDENAVARGFLLVAPVIRDGLRRTSYKCDGHGAGVWFCEVTYSWSATTATDDPTDDKDPNDETNLGPETSFDLTTQTAHITQSLETQYKWRSGVTTDTPAGDAIKYGTNATVTGLGGSNTTTLTLDGYAGPYSGKTLYISGGSLGSTGWTPGAYPITGGSAGSVVVTGRPASQGFFGGRWMVADASIQGTAANYKQAIGVTTDGIAGTDVLAPKFEFTFTRQVFPVNLPYLRRLRKVVAKTNDRPWRQFETGELLYLGATGHCGPDNVWTVNHKFAAGENLPAVQVSPSLMLPGKKAWEYVWCAYGHEADTTLIMQKPVAAYVETVYRAANFELLGLGK